MLPAGVAHCEWIPLSAISLPDCCTFSSCSGKSGEGIFSDSSRCGIGIEVVPASRSSSSNTVEHHILCSLQVYSAWKTGCAAEVHSHRTFRTPVLFYVLSVSVQVHESRRFPERSVPAPCFFLPFYKFLLHRHQKIIQFTLNFISAWNCTNHRIFYDLARFHHITNCNALNPFTPI